MHTASLWVRGQVCSQAVALSLLTTVPSLQSAGSRALAPYLQPVGLVALCQVGSLWTCDQAHVPCVSRLIPNYWTTREAPQFLIRYFSSSLFP